MSTDHQSGDHTKKKVMIFAESLLGGGHFKMVSLVAKDLIKQGFEVNIVTGSIKRGSLFDFGGANIVEIPEITKEFAYSDSGVPRELLEARRVAIAKAYEDIKPDAIMVETWPVSRGNLFDHELLPLLEEAKHERIPPKVYCMLRDVLFMPSAGSGGTLESTIDVFKQYFNGGVVVCGDDKFIPLEASYPAIAEVADKVRYTGYLVDDLPPRNEPSGEVVVSGGGGFHQHSTSLLTNTLESIPYTEGYKDRTWHFLVPENDANAAEEIEFMKKFKARAEEISRETGTKIIVEKNRPDFLKLMVNADLSICQAGYNSSIESVSSALRDGTPRILVPIKLDFMKGNDEQVFRTERFADMGLVTMVSQSDTSDAKLFGEAIAHAKAPKHKEGLQLLANGSENTAKLLKRDAEQWQQKAQNAAAGSELAPRTGWVAGA
ncbi:MAG: hypothetical protein SFT92_07850 [Rickettsiales bacterium]|nr:hypothetical protein [Rickettsiales bacterium]